ncbi:hypothetical protein [Nocardia sp. NBC_01327]|uniref:hypothetical protein n=1 Tax=Nocardia sp. NBC_01327 TaxID=2903593 RepID=UPI002E160A27|nr:hypothetical protein OG326_41805 [Nocardia sp. NBC_01327]
MQRARQVRDNAPDRGERLVIRRRDHDGNLQHLSIHGKQRGLASLNRGECLLILRCRRALFQIRINHGGEQIIDTRRRVGSAPPEQIDRTLDRGISHGDETRQCG